jgi:nucleotide-binding universal stress UspA family protein
MQIKNILLPVDGSIHSDHATAHAVNLAGLSGANITAVCCHELCNYKQDVGELLVSELQINVEKQAAEVLKKTAEIIKETGIEYTTKNISGAPGKVLVSLAESKEFDLIVMGSHGHSEILGLHLGSVTLKILRTIHCPVMVVS